MDTLNSLEKKDLQCIQRVSLASETDSKSVTY